MTAGDSNQSSHPGAGRDPPLQWIPAFAGMTRERRRAGSGIIPTCAMPLLAGSLYRRRRSPRLLRCARNDLVLAVIARSGATKQSRYDERRRESFVSFLTTTAIRRIQMLPSHPDSCPALCRGIQIRLIRFPAGRYRCAAARSRSRDAAEVLPVFVVSARWPVRCGDDFPAV
jgi:hypothetical protein